MTPLPPDLEAMHRRLKADAAVEVRGPAWPWWWAGATLAAFDAVLLGVLLTRATVRWEHFASAEAGLAVEAALVALCLLGSFLAVSPLPGPGVRLALGAGATLAVGSAAALSGVPHSTFWGGWSCSVVEVASSALPALVALLLLRRFAFDAWRALLGGVASGAVGLSFLHLVCGAGDWPHHLAFHALPCAVLAGALVLARRQVPSRSYAP
jgi:hypothetical protein